MMGLYLDLHVSDNIIAAPERHTVLPVNRQLRAALTKFRNGTMPRNSRLLLAGNIFFAIDVMLLQQR